MLQFDFAGKYDFKKPISDDVSVIDPKVKPLWTVPSVLPAMAIA